MTLPADRYDLAMGTAAYIGARRRPLILGWRVENPGKVAFLVGDPAGTCVEWWLDRQLLTAGVDMAVVDNGVRVWPCADGDSGLVGVRPAADAASFVVPEAALGRFLARTEFWVRLGCEDFDTAAAALLGGAR